MDNLNIKINGDISEDLLNMKLTDMFCKHVIEIPSVLDIELFRDI